MLFFGNDPGGAAANGVATLDVSPDGKVNMKSDTVDSADDALRWLHQNADGTNPEMAGIDTYLSWATGASGWRPMDVFIRRKYPQVKQSVFASNSASGSMAIQGIATAIRLRQIWPKILLNETHPKVQYFAISHQKYSYGHAMNTWLAARIGVTRIPARNEHEWDALFSAWASWRAHIGSWTNNLMPQGNNLIRPAGNVSYIWPP